MPDSTKNIKFKTSIEGNEQVEQEFDNINQSIKNTSDVADTKLKPAMVDAHQYTMRVGEATEETTSAFAGLTGSLLGGAGVVAAMLAARMIMDQFTKTELEAAEEGDKFRQTLINLQTAADVVNLSIGKATRSLREMTDEMLTIKLLQVDEDIRKIETGFSGLWKQFIGSAEAERDILIETKNQITEIQKLREAGISGEGLGILDRLREQIKLNTELRDSEEASLSEIATYSDNIKLLQTQLNELLGIEEKAMKDNTAEINRQNKELEKQVMLWRRIIRPYDYSGMAPMGDRKGGRGKEISGGGGASMTNNMLEDKEQLKRAEQYQQQFADSFTNILETNFSTFWTATFGEANSLLEQLLQATFGSILSQLVSGFLSFIPFGSFISSMASGAKSPAVNPQQIVLQINGQDAATFVNAGNDYNRMMRT